MAHFQNIDDKLYSKIHDFVNKRMGLYFSDNRKKDLVRGLNHAADNFGYKDVNTCIEQLITVNWTTTQIQTLANYLTIGETYFYRHKEHLEYVFNTFIKNKPSDSKIRIWSAACCSGEEPYSLAILSKEILQKNNKYSFEITGTDINPAFLKKAIDGNYTEHSLRILPEKIIKKYFTKEKSNKYILNEDIKNMVNFKYLNLASNTYPSEINNTEKVDIILCRNVFIYFQQATINKVISRFRKCLKNDGILFVAPAETFMIPHDIMQKLPQTAFSVFTKTAKITNSTQANKTTLRKPAISYHKTSSKHINRTIKTLKQKHSKTIETNTQSAPATGNILISKKYLENLKKLFSTGKYIELLQSYEKLDNIKLTKIDLKETYRVICKSYANINKLDKRHLKHA
jgi:chemotaxis protein methyltransferase CheR